MKRLKKSSANGPQPEPIRPPSARADGPSIGLALGGGGARGLAHIVMLEAFDELGITPKVMSGTSIGAIYGAAYASGISGKPSCEFVISRRSAICTVFPSAAIHPNSLK